MLSARDSHTLAIPAATATYSSGVVAFRPSASAAMICAPLIVYGRQDKLRAASAVCVSVHLPNTYKLPLMPMHIRTTRMEAFSDGVISIIITVMIFDIKFRELAHGFSEADVVTGMSMLWPKVVAYFFSFLILGIMWLNHHHM